MTKAMSVLVGEFGKCLQCGRLTNHRSQTCMPCRKAAGWKAKHVITELTGMRGKRREVAR